MNAEELPERDELLAALICQYEEAVRAGDDQHTFDESALGTDAELVSRFDAARRGVEALDRVRLLWSPPEAETGAVDDDTDLNPAETIDGKPRTIGRFRIQWELGRGGLGIVFLAHDPQLGRQVALKVPRIEALVNDEIRQRFMLEAAAAARLSHPHLVGVFDVGEDAGICYIASEYCPGCTLRRWIGERQKSVLPHVAARIAGNLAEAVQHAHGRGVLHRDIKPSNVLVEFQPAGDLARNDPNETPRVKLADFGMAKLLEHDGDQTRTGAILGTLSYMAPEQAEGRTADIDIRTDVYGLGAVLYELLTGRPPFQGDSEAETLQQLLMTEVAPPSRLRGDVPRDLEAICLKCLARDRRHRYNTAQELEDDLRRFLAGRPTKARPLRFHQTAWKWIRRRPWAAAIAGLAVVSAGGLLATVLVYNGRLKTEAARSDRSRVHAQQEAESRRKLLYSADVRLAYETLKANNVVQAIEALKRQIPATGESDLREFAWHYLRLRCEPDTRMLRGHENTVFAVAFSPTGDRLASASQDGTARIWDLTTGETLRILRGHTHEVTSVAFAPDGGTVATGSEDRSIRIWDAVSGETNRALTGHADHVQAVAFSPDGRWLASGCRGGTVRVWNAATGATQAMLDDNLDVVRSIAFSPAGDRLFAVDEVESLHVWETGGWSRVARERADRDKLFTVAVSRDGGRVAASGRRREINLWNVAQGQVEPLQQFESGHTEWVQSLAFSPVDDTLASGGKDGVIRLWKPGETVPERVLLGHRGRIWSVAWSGDGQALASAGESAGIRLWDLSQRPVVQYSSPPAAINWLAPTADGRRLMAGTWDGTIQIWDLAARQLVETFRAHDTKLVNVTVSPDGSRLATTAKGEDLKVWSRSPRQTLARIPVSDVAPIDWAPAGDRLATTIDESTAAIIDVASRRVVQRFPHEERVRHVLFLPDGRHLATTSLTRFNIWNIADGHRVFTIPESHTSLAVTRDGTALAAIRGASVSLIDVTNDFRVATLVTAGSDAKNLAFSPDGNTLAVSLLPPAKISLWDRRTKQELMRLPFDANYISNMVFSADGRHLFVGGIDANGKGGIWEWTIRNRH